MRLAELIEPLRALGAAIEPLPPAQRDLRITAIVSDSRAVRSGCLFVARRGTQVDGHSFVRAAVAAGAAAIVGSALLPPEVARLCQRRVPYVRVDDAGEALGRLSALAEGSPASELSVVGVTGTNGKTTVSTLLYELFTALGCRAGLIGTNGVRIGVQRLPSSHTTPDAPALQRLLREMVRAGCRYCFMEVTSHAIDQRRIAGVDFAGGIFTNLDHDHLDYHGTLEAYAAVKKRFLTDLADSAFALSNSGDQRGRWMVDSSRAHLAYCGRGRDALLPWSVEARDVRGMTVRIAGRRVRTQLIGDHNAANLAAAVSAGALLGEPVERILTVVPRLRGARGRMQVVADGPVLGIVDYAHTPEALRVAIASARALRPAGRLIIVAGCGGDRDARKRPAMGAVVASADLALFTADNPRSEAPHAIVEAMLRGVPAARRSHVHVELDRRAAIRLAAGVATPGDVVLVAGKGHETTHEIAGRKHAFDDIVELGGALGGFRHGRFQPASLFPLAARSV